MIKVILIYLIHYFVIIKIYIFLTNFKNLCYLLNVKKYSFFTVVKSDLYIILNYTSS